MSCAVFEQSSAPYGEGSKDGHVAGALAALLVCRGICGDARRVLCLSAVANAKMQAAIC